MSEYPEYSGMTYEQASREAEKVINRVGWLMGWDRLVVLRGIMLAHIQAATK